MIDFVSLHNHTYYSILDAISDPNDLFLRAKELGQKAIGITEHGSISSAWECLKASKQTGVRLIIGCECYFQENVGSDEKFRHIILIAKNAIGYRNLLTLNKRGFDQGKVLSKKVYSIIDWKLLEQYSEGLICLTACGNGIISQLLMNGKFDEAERTIIRLKELFGNSFGLEVHPNNMDRMGTYYSDKIEQSYINRKLINLGKKLSVRVVATCNSHYIRKEESSVHDTLLSIGSHQPIYSNFRLKYPLDDFYLKSGDEVLAFFTRNYGEEAARGFCENSIYFADLCEAPEWIDPKFSNPSGKELPVFPIKDETDYEKFLEWKEANIDKCPKDEKGNILKDDSLYLRYKCFNALLSFFERRQIKEYKKKEYIDRLEEELDTLDYVDVSSYMLIVSDYVNWSLNNGVAVGPGRGSCGGSLVAFLLGIHQADPIKYGLVFARFHSKLRKSYADTDLDFSKKNRNKVFSYIEQKYGKDNFSLISNVNTITPKVYVRDVARAYELGGTKENAVKIGDDVASIISADYHSINEALSKAPLFEEYCKRYPEFIKNNMISGALRSWGVHASGTIISKRPLTGLVPVRIDKDGAAVIEFDKDTAEEVGLVKMDILGLSELDTMNDVIDMIRKNGKEVPNIDFEQYDKETYDLISSGDTFGVFQFGKSGGTIDLCKKIKPKSMEDLAIITTLARPASKEIREDFIKTKKGILKVQYLHPLLKNAFHKTYGFPLYDESLLILAKDVAGWDLAEADKLRKLTKEKGKNPEKAKKWEKEFIEGAVKNGVSEKDANEIWERVILPYGKYSFNKSHAILYSIITYKTAYLKAHFPIEFLMANLMSELSSGAQDADEKVVKIKTELRSRGVSILAPNINTSEMDYKLIDDKTLLTGLNALKFVGEEAILDIVEKRPFKSFYDFMVRIDPHKVRSNTIQALIASGSMDCFGLPRKSMFLYCSDYRKKLQVWAKKHNIETDEFSYPWEETDEWKLHELYALEMNYLGEAFICAPADAYGKFFKDDHNTVVDIKQMKDKEKVPNMKCILQSFFEFKVKKEGSKYYGMPMIKAVIQDKNGEQCPMTIFSDRWMQMQRIMKSMNSKAVFDKGLALCFAGSTNNYEDEIGIIMEDLFSIALPPALPIDRKAKKINLKQLKEKVQQVLAGTEKEIEEEIEDDLINEGLLDLENDMEFPDYE
jgi:DNA polymerase-3 subunit alpha